MSARLSARFRTNIHVHSDSRFRHVLAPATPSAAADLFERMFKCRPTIKRDIRPALDDLERAPPPWPISNAERHSREHERTRTNRGTLAPWQQREEAAQRPPAQRPPPPPTQHPASNRRPSRRPSAPTQRAVLARQHPRLPALAPGFRLCGLLSDRGVRGAFKARFLGKSRGRRHENFAELRVWGHGPNVGLRVGDPE